MVKKAEIDGVVLIPWGDNSPLYIHVIDEWYVVNVKLSFGWLKPRNFHRGVSNHEIVASPISKHVQNYFCQATDISWPIIGEHWTTNTTEKNGQ